jgi:hypothetical protein
MRAHRRVAVEPAQEFPDLAADGRTPTLGVIGGGRVGVEEDLEHRRFERTRRMQRDEGRGFDAPVRVARGVVDREAADEGGRAFGPAVVRGGAGEQGDDCAVALGREAEPDKRAHVLGRILDAPGHQQFDRPTAQRRRRLG